MKTLESVQEQLEKVHSPESAMAEFEYLEYLERQGEKVCQLEKVALANIAQDSFWNQN